MIEHQVTNSYGNYNSNAYIYKNISYHQHFHANYELIYAMSGQTSFTTNGKADTLNEGEMVLISPYTVHTLEMSGQAKTWVGVFSADFISSFSDKYKYADFSKFSCSKETEAFLKKNLFFEGTPEHFSHIACLYLVCSECVRNADFSGELKDASLRYRVIEYVSQNSDREITMKQTAASLNYEYHYFSALFNDIFDMNFKSFINLFRFEKACRMLADKSYDMTKIVSMCGFGSIRNFNRVFKSISGKTPSEYRKKSI